MVFVPDSDANFQAYKYALGKVSGRERDDFIERIVEYFLLQCTLGATLVTNSAGSVSPNGTVASAISGVASSTKGKRNF